MLIAFEGIDGAGKDTQTKLLKARLRERGLSVEVLSFPRYGQTLFAHSIADYLNGKFGELSLVAPQFAALLYAGDRFASRELIAQLADTQQVVIFDRYVSSNIAYQAARVSAEQRPAFIAWVAQLEYEVYALPRADITVYLDVDAQLASRMVHQKKQRSYTADAADIHERNLGYLASCREVYHALANEQFGSRWHSIACAQGSEMRPISDIADQIWQVIAARLDDR